jgi:hypothetical protein
MLHGAQNHSQLPSQQHEKASLLKAKLMIAAAAAAAGPQSRLLLALLQNLLQQH